MTLKTIGAILIILTCGGFGVSLASAHKARERALRQLITTLEFMECELRYKLTPLPELCANAGKHSSGIIGEIFYGLAEELNRQAEPDAACCMICVLSHTDVPSGLRDILMDLGNTLGRFDLEGQLQGMESTRTVCKSALAQLTNNHENRLRNYQTLALCAGAALVILFI